jgi:glycosyltransferase involved in cell wall biosynthesis
MRVCLIYDCLFPYTVGGAERVYRKLSQRLAEAGHEVTYLTLRQWDRDEIPDIGGARVVTVGPRMKLYTGDRRRILPPLVFGVGVFWHLLRHGRRYDIVHTAAFPYFGLLAASAVARVRRFGIVVDWHEVWSRSYWREYLGPVAGRVGWFVQRLCIRVPQRAFSFSRLHARRLREEGLRGEITVLEGEYTGSVAAVDPVPAEPIVVFAGRHIPEKRAPSVVTAVARARETVPDLRAEIYGDGPEHATVLRTIARTGLEDVVSAPGFVEFARVDASLRRALCMVLPSRREGYGLIVIEAAALGTPSVVVAEEDNAAVELIEDGVNGVVAASARPDDLAAAILRIHAAGHAMRESTAAWFAQNAQRLSLDSSLDRVLTSYADSSR